MFFFLISRPRTAASRARGLWTIGLVFVWRPRMLRRAFRWVCWYLYVAHALIYLLAIEYTFLFLSSSSYILGFQGFGERHSLLHFLLQLFPPSWHLLHLHLDVHWAILEILHIFGQKMTGNLSNFGERDAIMARNNMNPCVVSATVLLESFYQKNPSLFHTRYLND